MSKKRSGHAVSADKGLPKTSKKDAIQANRELCSSCRPSLEAAMNSYFIANYRSLKILPEAELTQTVQSLLTPLGVCVRVDQTRTGWEKVLEKLNVADSDTWLPVQAWGPHEAGGKEGGGQQQQCREMGSGACAGVAAEAEKQLVFRCSDKAYGRVREWAESLMGLGVLHCQELVSMLPALLLDPHPSDFVLDMCAAPGSKTLHAAQLMKAKALPHTPSGAILAADNSVQRSCMVLTRNLPKSYCGGNVLSVLHNSLRFPDLYLKNPDKAEVLKPDRIICDVPCSGDGTARKNPSIWRSWKVNSGLELFNKQKKLLMKGLYLLKPGGRLVYSTCSLNPVENEALVLACLTERKDALLLDAHSLLKRRGASIFFSAHPGSTQWAVSVKTPEGVQVFDRFDDVPGSLRFDVDTYAKEHRKGGNVRNSGMIRKECFPHFGGENVSELTKCMRVWPHLNDSGGFFVAVFSKALPEKCAGSAEKDPDVSVVNGDGESEESSAAKRHESLIKKSRPFITWTFQEASQHPTAFTGISEFYGLPELPKTPNLFRFQVMQDGAPKRLMLVSAQVDRLLQAKAQPRTPLAFVVAGRPLFELYRDGFMKNEQLVSRYRPTLEGAEYIARFAQKRVIQCDDKNALIDLLKTAKTLKTHFTDPTYPSGGCVIKGHDLFLPVTMTPNVVLLYCSKVERKGLLAILGADLKLDSSCHDR